MQGRFLRQIPSSYSMPAARKIPAVSPCFGSACAARRGLPGPRSKRHCKAVYDRAWYRAPRSRNRGAARVMSTPLTISQGFTFGVWPATLAMKAFTKNLAISNNHRTDTGIRLETPRPRKPWRIARRIQRWSSALPSLTPESPLPRYPARH